MKRDGLKKEIKVGGGLLTTCLLVAIVSGCFQANNQFYRESDIVRDKRLEGRFQEPNAQTNSSTFLSIKLGENGHYTATFNASRKFIRLDVVLFKCGPNLFADIKRVADNGLNHEPAVGPSGLELLHMATQYNTHSVVRLRFNDKGFDVGCNHGNPIYNALQNYPYLKFRVGTKTEPLDPHQKILTNPTEELYKFLETAGTNETVFKFGGGFERTGE